MKSDALSVHKQTLKFIEKAYGTKMCKTYSPGCPNCSSQILRGHLLDEISLIEWENDQAREKNKTVAKRKSKTKKAV